SFGRVPSTNLFHQFVGLARSPRSALVFVKGARAVQDGIDDGPRRLDDVLAREERSVARDRVAEKSFVVAEAHGGALGTFLEKRKLDVLARHPVARLLATRADRDRDLGTQTKPDDIAPRGRRLAEHDRRRILELDGHL